jgi:hypothetical protein
MQAKRRRRFLLGRDDLVDDVAHKSAPTIGFGQPRRICSNMVKTLAAAQHAGLIRIAFVTDPSAHPSQVDSKSPK